MNQIISNTLLQAEIGCWTIGCPARGKRGFGTLNDNGRNRVPAIPSSPVNIQNLKEKGITYKSKNSFILKKIFNFYKEQHKFFKQRLINFPTIFPPRPSKLNIQKAQLGNLKLNLTFGRSAHHDHSHNLFLWASHVWHQERKPRSWKTQMQNFLPHQITHDFKLKSFSKFFSNYNSNPIRNSKKSLEISRFQVIVSFMK